MNLTTTAATQPSRTVSAGLIALYIFSLVAVIGYATFGLNPGLLARYPSLAGFYGVSFQFFAQAQIWLAGLVIGFFLFRYAQWRWLPAFVALYLISLGSEMLGTTVGIPFGEYRYTDALGAMWFDHVPVLIPLSWFFMALPSYAIAQAALPTRPLGRIVMASLILLGWDLALDPAMSHATRYWIWAEPGSYYGMPWLNLFGWYVTGLALMGALAALRSERWISDLPLRWLMAVAVRVPAPSSRSTQARPLSDLWTSRKERGPVSSMPQITASAAAGRPAARSYPLWRTPSGRARRGSSGRSATRSA